MTKDTTNTHPAYDVFLLWRKDQQERDWERFRCWREIEMAKEDQKHWLQGKRNYREPPCRKRYHKFVAKVRFDSSERKRMIANGLELDKSCGKDWRSYDPDHTPSLRKSIQLNPLFVGQEEII